MRTNISTRKDLLLIISLVITTQLLLVHSAWSAGPVDATSLPGGATVTDTDLGSGEQWGRAGGRTYGFSDFVLSNFTLLEYQPISAAAAFDNEITGGTLEMVGPALIAPNTLRWTGETEIYKDIAGVWVTAYTRFTVVSTQNFSGPPPYVVNVIGAAGTFEINVLFEASLAPGGPWDPALDFFDAYPTGIGQDGFAHTSFSDGFFYEVEEGLTLEEHDANLAAHDANVQSRFDTVDNDIQFLTLESQGWFGNINDKVMDNNGKLMLIQSDIDQLLEGGGDDHATHEDINNLQNYIMSEIDSLRDALSESQQLLLCLWIGNDIFPVCPEEVPPGLVNLLSLEAGQAELMDKLDALMEQSESSCSVEVKARHSASASVMSTDVLAVLTTLEGVPTDADVLAVTAVTESKASGIGAVALDFSAAPVTTGLQSLEVDIPGGIGKVRHLVIEVEHAVDEDTSCAGTGLADLLGSGSPGVDD